MEMQLYCLPWNVSRYQMAKKMAATPVCFDTRRSEGSKIYYHCLCCHRYWGSCDRSEQVGAPWTSVLRSIGSGAVVGKGWLRLVASFEFEHSRHVVKLKMIDAYVI